MKVESELRIPTPRNVMAKERYRRRATLQILYLKINKVVGKRQEKEETQAKKERDTKIERNVTTKRYKRSGTLQRTLEEACIVGKRKEKEETHARRENGTRN